MPALETAGKVVMAVEIPVAIVLNEPGTTAGATGHVAGEGDHHTAPMPPQRAGGSLAGLSRLTIERIPGWIAIGVERLVDRLIICPTGAAHKIRQITLAIGSN